MSWRRRGLRDSSGQSDLYYLKPSLFQLAAPSKPNPDISLASQVLLAEQHLDSHWRYLPWFLLWIFEATISTASVDCLLNLNRWPQRDTG